MKDVKVSKLKLSGIINCQTFIISFIFLLNALILFFNAPCASADIYKAINYLESSKNLDGSWGTESRLLFFETTEVLEGFRASGVIERSSVIARSSYNNAVEFINAMDIWGTQDISRKLMCFYSAGKDISALRSSILANYNSDDGYEGWGFDK